VPSEQPLDSIKELQRRTENEMLWQLSEAVTCTVTVQGWFRTGNELWWPGDKVFIYSPMCPLNQIMVIKAVTFSQDSVNGTETTLLLVQPWALHDTQQPLHPGMAPPVAASGPAQPGQQYPYPTYEIPPGETVLPGAPIT
jgi:prophage tail gpP-like protein